MTVLNTTMQNNYAGNGVAASFAFTFKVYRAEDLNVLTINNSTGAVTPLVLGVDYTVNEYGLDTGGQITLTGGALAAGITIWLTRIMSRTQETNFSNQGAYLPENTEETLDQQDMMAIEDLFRFNRALTIPLTDVPLSVLPTATLRASMYLGFDVTGQPVMLAGTGGIGTVNENQLVLSDVTTANVSITKHGFAPKAPNDATKFLRGDATWAAVPLSPTEAAIFTANGNFTPLTSGNYLVIGYGGGGGGGGGGGTNTVSGGAGGAGGGGGSVSASVVALVAGTPYAVVIGTGGGGGAAGAGNAGGGDGTGGNNTTFNGVTVGAGGSGGRGNSANVSNIGVGLAGGTGGGNGGAAGGAKIAVSNNNGNPGANAPANTGGGGGGGGGGATSGGTNGGGAGGNGGSGYLTVVRC